MNNTIVLDPLQEQAIALCCDVSVTNRISGVTGAAGTGKTTIMRQTYEKLDDNGYKVQLCAPTGKAAKRIREATGIGAVTIHMLLEYPHPGERDDNGKPLRTTEPKRHRGNPLEQDVILVDEAAMVNSEVYRNLIDALAPGACIRFFGDINQLPPIEKDDRLKFALSPFEQVLQRYKNVKLDTLHRQGEGSGIVENGRYIIQGRTPRRTADFDYTITDKPLEQLSTFLESDINVNDWRTTENQIITPTNIGWIGTHKLNALLQARFQKDTPVTTFRDIPRHKWQEKHGPVAIAPNDKVIWTENNYDLKIFNGETGIIMEISDLDEVVIDFGDRSVVVPPSIETTNQYGKVVTYDPRHSIDLAYAVTTHKSQGSEYNRVLYMMHSSRPFGLNRKNFYTGVTRARHSVQIICDQRALSLSMRMN